ncbi:hypothetical protein [Nocardioides sp. REDSEA-S30_B4]|uniref:hypothetical protein n=1 Tax=Nocardioides sp. REDSEA-S30_B4 TaxID=1811552 RepID=UPI000A948561|nr:hypothetical protein [Nocardioides sp. REDSEA-S30_B4]
MDKFVALPSSEDRLVLEQTGDGYYGVIARVRSDGSVAWRAHPPDGPEGAWVDARIEDDTLLAIAFSGWLVRLDLQSGRELERVFTK